MAQASNDILVKVTVDDKEYHKAMVKMARGLSKVEREAKLVAKAEAHLNGETKKATQSLKEQSAAASSVRGGMVSVRSGMLAAAASIAAVTVAAKALDAAFSHGLKSQGIYQALPFAIDATAEAMGGLASNFEIAKHASRQAALGLNFTASQFQDLAKAAAIAGQKMGIDASFALDRLITGLGRASPKLLDDLGIMVKAGKANREYAAALGIVTQAMTDAQKETAFRTFALKELNRVASTGTLITKGFGAQWAKAKVSVANAWDTITRSVSSSSTALDILADKKKKSSLADLEIEYSLNLASVGSTKRGEERIRLTKELTRKYKEQRKAIEAGQTEEQRQIANKRVHIGLMSVLNPAMARTLEIELRLHELRTKALRLDNARIKTATDLTNAHISRVGVVGKLNRLMESETKRHERLTEAALKQAKAMDRAAASTRKAAQARRSARLLAADANRDTSQAWSAALGAMTPLSIDEQRREDEQESFDEGADKPYAQGMPPGAIDSVLAYRDALNESSAASAELAANTVSMGDKFLSVLPNVDGFTNSLMTGIDAVVMGRASLGQALAGMTRDLLMQIGKKSLKLAAFEFAEGVAMLATTWGVPNTSSIGHFAAAAGFAALGGGAIAGGYAAGSATGGGPTASAANARTPGGSIPESSRAGSASDDKKPLIVNIRFDRSDPHALRMAQAKIRMELAA